MHIVSGLLALMLLLNKLLSYYFITMHRFLLSVTQFSPPTNTRAHRFWLKYLSAVRLILFWYRSICPSSKFWGFLTANRQPISVQNAKPSFDATDYMLLQRENSLHRHVQHAAQHGATSWIRQEVSVQARLPRTSSTLHSGCRHAHGSVRTFIIYDEVVSRSQLNGQTRRSKVWELALC